LAVVKGVVDGGKVCRRAKRSSRAEEKRSSVAPAEDFAILVCRILAELAVTPRLSIQPAAPHCLSPSLLTHWNKYNKYMLSLQKLEF
jgi:hypothetical protein